MKLHSFGKQNPKAKKVERLERDPIQMVVPLMNHYHSLESRYFSKASLRKAEQTAIESQIHVLLKEADISPELNKAIHEALDSKKYWDSIRDRLF